MREVKNEKTSRMVFGNIKDVIRSTHEILTDKMEIAEDIETVVTGCAGSKSDSSE